MAVAACVAAAATTAHAAGLPPVSAMVYASAGSADAMPTTLVSDPFTGTTGVSIDGRTASTGQPWSVLRGRLEINSNRVQCTTCNGDYAAAIIDADLAQVTVSVKIRVTNTSGPVGVILNSDQNATRAFVVWYDNNNVQLLRYVGGSISFPIQQAVAPVPLNTDVPLVVTYSNGAYAVSLNGASVFTYTLTAADQLAANAGTYFGIIDYLDPTASRLDDFSVIR